MTRVWSGAICPIKHHIRIPQSCHLIANISPRPSVSRHVQTPFDCRHIPNTQPFQYTPLITSLISRWPLTACLIEVVTMVVERVSLNLPRVSLSADTSSSVSNHSNSSASSPPKANHRLSFQTPPSRTCERDRDYSFVTEGEYDSPGWALELVIMVPPSQKSNPTFFL